MKNNVSVGIIMGSDSDLPVMKDAAKILDDFGIKYELTIVSAHRTPERLVDYGKTARDRGLDVIIAGAGGAAHLPGMIASLSEIPVIGVPVKTSTLGGADSLYSMVQMPSGVPVATVALNGAQNAAILALQIMAAGDKSLQQEVIKYKEQLKEESLQKDKNLSDKIEALEE